MKRVVFIIILLCFLLAGSREVQAADIAVSCDASSCSPDTIPDFFDNSFVWYPTASQTQTITITNTSGTSQYIGHRAENTYVTPGENIASVLDLVVRRQSDNAVVWSGTLQELYSGAEVGLGTLPAGETDTYRYRITMRNVGNEYQGKNTQFDLEFGYYIPTSTPTPTHTPTPTPPGNSGNNNGNGQNGNNNSSNGNGNTNNGQGQVQGETTPTNPINQFFSNVLGLFNESDSQEVESQDSKSIGSVNANSGNDGQVAGEEDEICRNASWWWIAILGYGISSIILLVLGKRISYPLRMGVHSVATLTAISLLIYALCNWYFAVVLVLILGVVAYFLIEGFQQSE